MEGVALPKIGNCKVELITEGAAVACWTLRLPRKVTELPETDDSSQNRALPSTNSAAAQLEALPAMSGMHETAAGMSMAVILLAGFHTLPPLHVPAVWKSSAMELCSSTSLAFGYSFLGILGWTERVGGDGVPNRLYIPKTILRVDDLGCDHTFAPV